MLQKGSEATMNYVLRTKKQKAGIVKKIMNHQSELSGDKWRYENIGEMKEQKKMNESRQKLQIILHQMHPEVQGKDPGNGPQCGLDHVCLQEGRDFRLGGD